MAKDNEGKKRAARRILRKIFPAYFALLLALSAGLIVITFFGDPNAGQAAAALDLPLHISELPLEKPAKVAAKPPPADEHADEHTDNTPLPPADELASADPAIQHPDKVNVLPQVQQFGLTERVGQGYLPRIASDGTKPMDAYAGKVPAGKHPRISILIGHLGISENLTRKAEELLPSGVTLAFSPYAQELDTLIRHARRRGHEVLLELPMEPKEYPANDAGPYTLLVRNPQLINLQHLAWVMSRAAGYTGLTNAQGGEFLTHEDALEPVLKFLTRRGLLFFEAGCIAKTRGPAVARATGTAYGSTDVEIDKVLTPQAIDAALKELVTQAKRQGHVSGYAQPYPLVVDRINLWSKTLKRKGVVLAPVSALVSHPKP